jgi:PKHD-type hydroxylase
MKSWWYNFSGALEPFEVQYIHDYAKRLPSKDGTVGHGDGTSRVRKSTRDSTIKWIERNALSRWLFDRAAVCVAKANKECFNFDLPNEPYLHFNSFQYTQYCSKGEQHYDWHVDNRWIDNNPASWDRKVSLVIQMTDPSKYEGGRLQFDGMEIPENQFTQPGDMIIFPSFLKHRVTPVTKGTRQSLVTWISGPRFK